MHETMFIKTILNALKQKFGDDPGSAGRAVVNARLSPFCHVSAESLKETFDEMIKEEGYKGVSLNVLPLEIPVVCGSCKRDTLVDKKIFGCPFCGSANVKVQMDKEFFVESVR
jgi:Zn finger protein HypA/HybF involved in hydrogenase expression